MAAEEKKQEVAEIDIQTAKVDSDKFFAEHKSLQKMLDEIKEKNDRWPLHSLYEPLMHDYIFKMSDYLINESKLSYDDLTLNEFGIYNDMPGIAQKKNKYPLMLFEAFSNARSRILLNKLNNPTHLTMIVPMWGEQERMKPSTKENPYGENFINEKIRQLKWLYNGIKDNKHTYNIIFVDDGCPNKSGDLAKEFMKNDKELSSLFESGIISVEYLQEALDNKLKEFNNLKNVNDSRKGGAVLYGFYCATNKTKEIKSFDLSKKEHFVIFTDSDLSTDIAQAGLLLHDVAKDGNNKDGKKMLGLADRYGKGIFSKGYFLGTVPSNYLGLRLRSVFRSKLMPVCRGLTDIQCGFKILPINVAIEMVNGIKNYDNMFDSEILLLTDKLHNKDGGKISSVGIVWLHSVALTTNTSDFGGGEFSVKYGKTHYKQLLQIINIHNLWYKDSNDCDKKWVDWISKLTWEQYFHIAQVLYSKIDTFNVHTYDPTIDDLEKILKEEYPKNAPKMPPFEEKK